MLSRRMMCLLWLNFFCFISKADFIGQSQWFLCWEHDLASDFAAVVFWLFKVWVRLWAGVVVAICNLDLIFSLIVVLYRMISRGEFLSLWRGYCRFLNLVREYLRKAQSRIRITINGWLFLVDFNEILWLALFIVAILIIFLGVYRILFLIVHHQFVG
jgi:hypothetical protein